MTILIREKPPLRIHTTIETPDGSNYRWGTDSHVPDNTLSDTVVSSVMPGGFEQGTHTLPRSPATDYPDLAEFSIVTVRGAGGEIVYQGRTETSPRTSGNEQTISVGTVGLQAALDDNNAAREIYIDCDLSQWQGPSVQRQLNRASIVDFQDFTLTPDATTGAPALDTGITFEITRATFAEPLYDARGITLAQLFYSWELNGLVNSADTNWSWLAGFANDDTLATNNNTGNLRAAGPGSSSVLATVATPTCAFLQAGYIAAAGSTIQSKHEAVLWTYLGVVGAHGLTMHGFSGGVGVLASDVVAHAVGKYASSLALSDTAGVSTVEISGFVIPQLVFKDPTTASNIIKAATQYELMDWWIDEGPTFHLASPANHGRDWRARVGPSGLQENGPQADRIYNGAIVSYTDTAGSTFTVGPPGSGANTEDASLFDSDSSNAATAAGLTRNAPPIALGTSTSVAAIKVGQAFLAYQRQLSTAGQASIVGYTEDMNTGVIEPAWKMRAGDRVTFVDAHDPVPRRIVRAEYTDSTRTVTLDLDSPPDALQALLARISVDLAPLGAT